MKRILFAIFAITIVITMHFAIELVKAYTGA